MQGFAGLVQTSIDAVVCWIGKAMGWILFLVVLLVFASTFLRYLFGIGYAWLQELYIWLNGSALLLAAAYAWRDDAQVRVEIFRQRFSLRQKAWVEVLGTLFVLLPTLGIIAYWSWTPIRISWRILERSSALDGLPGVYLMKSVVLLFCAIMALQAVGVLVREGRRLAARA